MAISYQKCPVTINGVALFATSATLDQTQNTQALRALGKSVVSTAVTEVPQGTFSADFHITSATIASTFASTAFKTDGAFFTCVLGGLTISKCVLTSFNVTAGSNSIVTASISVTYYGNLVGDIEGTASTGTVTVAHAAKSTVSAAIGFSDLPYSFSYDLSKEYTVNYSVGQVEVEQSQVSFASATETVSVEGDNLPDGIAKDLGSASAMCPSDYDLSIALVSTCGDAYGSVGLTDGIVTTRNVTVAENDIVRGNATVTKYH